MAEGLSDRLRPSELVEALSARRAAVQGRFTATVLVIVAAIAASVVVTLAAATSLPDLTGVVLAVGIMGGILSVIFGSVVLRTVRSESVKASFAEELTRAMFDDFHPRSKVGVDLVLGGHDRTEVRYWSGKSLHGNPKHKYADRWLTLRFHLADGTRVRLVRKADVKTKKGSVERHKRQLYVHVVPNPARYGPGPWDTSVLDGLVRTAVARKFHDPPEELRVRAASRGATIDLKVTQLDAEILVDEVVALLDATMSAVHLHQLDPK